MIFESLVSACENAVKHGWQIARGTSLDRETKSLCPFVALIFLDKNGVLKSDIPLNKDGKIEIHMKDIRQALSSENITIDWMCKFLAHFDGYQNNTDHEAGDIAQKLLNMYI